MGVKHLGSGSKIIITSREKQVLKSGGADTIHEVKALNKNDSLQLFSTFAFKQLNPAVGFHDLSCKFLEYAQGNPLALRVLGCNLYERTINDWESEMEKLREYSHPEIFVVLKSSYDRLGMVEKNIFLDIACFFKGEPIKRIKHVLSCYRGVEDGISKLVSKCLINISPSSSTHNEDLISMHDMLEELGKDIIRQKSKTPGKCRRLWSHEHIKRVLKYNQELVNLREIYVAECNNLRKICNLSRAINLESLDCTDCQSLVELGNEGDRTDFVNLRQIDFNGCVSLRKIPNLSRAINLEYLDCSNCKSLVELWNGDDCMDLDNLTVINVSNCSNLRKMPDLSRAINLEFLDCTNCKSLVELPCLDQLASLSGWCLHLNGCHSLKKFPQVPRHFCSLDLSETEIEEVPDSIKDVHKLETLWLGKSKVKNVSINILKLEFLRKLDLSDCPIEEVSLPFDPLCNLQHLNMSGSAVKNVSIKLESLRKLNLNGCPKVEVLSELPPYLKVFSANDCTSLEKVSFADQNLYQFDSLVDEFCRDHNLLMRFCNCFNLNQESTKNIEANAMLKIGSLAKEWAATYGRKDFRDNLRSLICCFPGNEISANKFKYRSLNSSLSLKISKNGGSGSRFLVFAICLVANLAHRHDVLLRYIGEYQLTAAGGGNGGDGCENFRSEISHFSLHEPDKYMDYHVFILSSIDMVIEDKNYEEASFKFYVRLLDLGRGGEEYIKVERCGVHVFYVDKKSDSDATEKRVAGNNRSSSHDGEEGD
ncbi:hypothetical protein E1A91_D10G287100v1 [Gossypium mustelinum]|uniref:Disease resistance protein Roq1-like winged-helix domain-containing protein n=1 Tax=Gossypium mustelinum TaxID=34275 RepID=A0A5D2TDC6_GOSMU|nr:hypothetical protein E1A91_D10G287100v1 [Gossypium mustelinum]